jgi:prepilin-type N-terminal cleavage/methylation domain-containing protein
MRNIFDLSKSKREARCAAKLRLDDAAGFSLIELLIAMTIVLIMMVGASQLLMSSLGVRTRENQKSDALADAQRALNIMSREIGNTGFGLDYNGIVAVDCHPTAATDPISAQIRIRANLNNTDATTGQADEDVTYVYQGSPTFAIVRYDKSTNVRTVLANRIDAMQIYYIDASGNVKPSAAQPIATAADIANAVRVRITIQVNLQPTVGQPASQVLLTSEIALRNAPTVMRTY